MKKQRSFRNMLIMLGVIAVAFFIAYYFIYQDIKAKNENISSLAQQLDFQSSRQEYLLSTQRMIENIRADIDRIDHSIVSSGGDVEFIEKLEAVAKDNGLTITIDSLGIEDDTAFSATSITTLKVRAKTKGSWVGTYTFLAQLESLPFKVRVNRFAFLNDSDAAPGTKTPSSWQSSFEIRVLKYK